MITEFNKNRFYNKSNLIVFSTATTLTNTNFYYNFISSNKTDINIHNLDLNNIYLSIYNNKNLYKNYDFIGIFTKEYDHHTIYEYLDHNTIYIHKSNLYMVINNKILPLIRTDIEPIIKSYNDYFNTNYSIKYLDRMPFSMSINVIYPIKIFEELCGWLSVSYINLHYQMAIFNAFLEVLNIEYLDIQYNIRHYDHIPSLDYLYLSDAFETTEYIENISTDALKTIKYNGILIEQKYSQDRYSIIVDNKEYYNNLDPYDPIPIYYNNKLHIVFSGLTKNNNCHRIMYLTDLDTLIPLKSNKIIEKNWIPFIHNDNNLYFIKSFNPLTYYDYNNDITINKNINYNYYPKGNLIFHNDMYIGLCYHKEYKNNIKYQGTFVYFIDPNTLDIIKISNQLQFKYCSNTPNPTIKCFDHNDTLTTLNDIIVSVSSTFYKNNLLYSIMPLYIYKNNNEIFIIVNIQHCLSFIYKLNIKPF